MKYMKNPEILRICVMTKILNYFKSLFKKKTGYYVKINDLVALVRKAKNDNLDDNYVYTYYNSLENKISRIGLALNSVGDT